MAKLDWVFGAGVDQLLWVASQTRELSLVVQDNRSKRLASTPFYRMLCVHRYGVFKDGEQWASNSMKEQHIGRA